jgi:ribosome maturation factor RimP
VPRDDIQSGRYAHFLVYGRVNLIGADQRVVPEMHERLQQMIEPLVNGQGCELWGVEFVSSGNHTFLKIFIDSKEGVDIDDCERVSRQVSSLLDVEDPLPGKYTLEVSSPGMDRRFFRPSQYGEYVGARVSVKLRQLVNGRRNLKGRLSASDGKGVTLLIDDEEFSVPIAAIERAHVIPEF